MVQCADVFSKESFASANVPHTCGPMLSKTPGICLNVASYYNVVYHRRLCSRSGAPPLCTVEDLDEVERLAKKIYCLWEDSISDLYFYEATANDHCARSAHIAIREV